MIEPYTCVGLIPTVYGIRERSDIMKNIDHLAHLTKAAAWLSGLDIPVRLLVVPEGALQGFNDEVLDLDHKNFANTCAIDIPGPETKALGKIARQYGIFIMAQAKARHPEWRDRFFNVGFVLDPQGEVILTHYKLAPLFPVEHSVTPYDVFDWWVERYGRSLQSFWPVVDTEIGRLGVMMANEASYPENGRGLAMNGCEIAYRASFPHPGTGNDFFEISSRARALENNMYVLSPNMGTYYIDSSSDIPIDTFGGRSMIVDYRGAVIGKQSYGGVSTYVAGVINIEQLRHHRVNARVSNWMKDVHSDLARLIYEKEIYPKNLYMNREPMNHEEYSKKVIDKQIELMQERGIWKAPSSVALKKKSKKRD